MKSLPALFTLTMSILLAGMVQGGRSVSILAGPGANPSVPSFSGNVLALSPLLVKTMTSLPNGIQQPAPPDSANPGDAASPRSGADISVTQERRTTRNLSPVWWAIGALVLVVVIAMIAMSTRGSSGTTVVRG